MPVSRRPLLRRPVLAKKRALPAPLQTQVQRLRQRHLLGQGFAARLKAPARGPSTSARWASTAVRAALGALGMLLAALHESPVGAGLGAGVLLVGAVATAWLRRAARPASTLRWWDEQAVQQLDALLLACATELPAPALATLDEMKAAFARMAPHLNAGPPGPPFRPDDVFFLAEVLRRYAPDSLHAYLQVPAAQREVLCLAAEAGEVSDEASSRSAQTLLCTQLQGLHTQVLEREQRLAQACAQGLLSQGRFLRAKL
jgi:hypothetical protein